MIQRYHWAKCNLLGPGVLYCERPVRGCYAEQDNHYKLAKKAPNKMNQINFGLVILLFLGITYAQAPVKIQTEELNITEIEAKAIVDARTDFDRSQRLTWGGGSILSGLLSVFAFSGLEDHATILVPMGLALASGPPIAAKVVDVNIPKTRIMELAFDIKSERDRSVYRSQYISETKRLRLTYTLASPVVSVVTGLALFVWLFVLGGVAN